MISKLKSHMYLFNVDGVPPNCVTRCASGILPFTVSANKLIHVKVAVCATILMVC